jgi:hypothetical protein
VQSSRKETDVSEVLTASVIIAVMMEAVSTSETSVDFYQTTRRNIPEVIFISDVTAGKMPCQTNFVAGEIVRCLLIIRAD